MPQPLTIAENFPQASLKLKRFLDQLHNEIATLHRSSQEAYQGLKQDILRSWQNSDGILKKYKTTLAEMPKELRKREFFKTTVKDIEKFESEIRHYLSDIKELSFQDFRKAIDERIRRADIRFKNFQSHIRDFTQKIDELEEETVIQKFLRGETVLSSKKTIQWGRKFGHAFTGTLFFYLFVFSGMSKPLFWSLAGGFVLTCIVLETARHMNPKINQWVCKWFRPIMRESEKTRINSAMFYIVSILFIYLVFPLPVTILALLFLAIGDPIAGIAGVYLGKTKLAPHVSLEGTLACYITCSVITLICTVFLFEQSLSFFALMTFSTLCGVVGALAESSFKKLDDNLVMPVLSAPFLWILMKVFAVL